MAGSLETQGLIDLFNSINGIEPDKLSDQEAIALKATALERFRVATGFLPALLAKIANIHADHFTGVVTPTPDWQTDYLGDYTLKHTEHLDRFIGLPETIQMAASLFSPLRFRIQLFAEADHPGYQHKPHILMTLECLDDPAAWLLEASVEALKDELQALAAMAVEVEIISFEGDVANIKNPPNISMAISECASSIRDEAKSNGEEFLEGMALQFKFDSTSEPSAIYDTARILMTILHRVWGALLESDEAPQ